VVFSRLLLDIGNAWCLTKRSLDLLPLSQRVIGSAVGPFRLIGRVVANEHHGRRDQPALEGDCKASNDSLPANWTNLVAIVSSSSRMEGTS